MMYRTAATSPSGYALVRSLRGASVRWLRPPVLRLGRPSAPPQGQRHRSMTGEISLRHEKKHAAELKRLGYRRHPQGAGWVRPVRRAWFPRFHLYATVDWNAKQIRFDLHLDHTREDVDSRAPTASG